MQPRDERKRRRDEHESDSADSMEFDEHQRLAEVMLLTFFWCCGGL